MEPGENPSDATLSAAEHRVALCVVAGMSNKEIAQSLYRSVGTIKCQVASILEKAGVPSRSRYIANYYLQILAMRSVANADTGVICFEKSATAIGSDRVALSASA